MSDWRDGEDPTIPDSGATDGPTALESMASFWFARMNADAVSAQDHAAFTAWLGAAPGHAQQYREHQRLWAELRVIADSRPVLALRAQALRQTGRRHWPLSVAAPLATVVLGVCVLGGWMVYGARHQSLTYATGEGQRLIATLPDHTQVTLAPHTHLRVDYRPGERAVMLRDGQAFFNVAHDAARPFRVTARDRVVTALGTVFQVTVEGEVTKVVLVEGSVAVASTGRAPRSGPGGGRVLLTPGHSLSGPVEAARVRLADVEVETAWRSGRLVFRDRPLAEVVADFNRYASPSLVLDDATVGTIRVSGSFRYENAAAFAATLQQNFGLTVDRDDHGRLRIGR